MILKFKEKENSIVDSTRVIEVNGFDYHTIDISGITSSYRYNCDVDQRVLFSEVHDIIYKNIHCSSNIKIYTNKDLYMLDKIHVIVFENAELPMKYETIVFESSKQFVVISDGYEIEF